MYLLKVIEIYIYIKSISGKLSPLNVGIFYFVFANMWLINKTMLFTIITMEFQYEFVSSLK